MRFEEISDYLFALRAHGSRLGLERMRALSARLGNPERALRIVHVAGTNGKGSVCALIESALRAAGYSTGLYTSPHLAYLGERIQINRANTPPETLCRLVETLKPHAEALAREDPELAPTFFEFMTAAAFLNFAQAGVDVAVVETGLGGRFDSTNIIESPLAAVITSIGLDHTEYLGGTLEKIAFEKGGIFKCGAPAVLGEMAPEAELVLRACARDAGAPKTVCVRERFGGNLAEAPACALKGAYQRRNAATAALALETIAPALPRLTPDAVRAGFAAAQWPGRWQTFALKDGRTLILEGAHNPEGARFLGEELSQLRAQGRRIAAVVGVCGEARAQAILAPVAKYADKIFLVGVSNPRATPPARLRALLDKSAQEKTREASLAGIFPAPATSALPDGCDTILVCGSLYLVGETLSLLDPERWNARGLGFQDLLADSPRGKRRKQP